MTNHDPMCPSNEPANLPLCRCDLIARVRDDERDKHIKGVWDNGYTHGYAACKSDAVEAVKGVTAYAYLGTPLSVVQRDEAVAAIEALGGES